MDKKINVQDLLNPNPKEKTLSGLMSQIEELAKGGDAQAKELMAQMEPLKAKALQMVESRKQVREALDQQRELDRKKEITHWVKRVLGKGGDERKRMSPEELEIFRRLGAQILSYDAAILKRWQKSVKIEFPNGQKGAMEFDYDDKGLVSHMILRESAPADYGQRRMAR